jgi:hypothetical protein
MIRSNNDRLAFKARFPEPRKAISIYAHHDDLWSFAQLAISVPDRRKGAYFWSHARSANQCVQIIQGLPIDGPLLNKNLDFLHT